MATDKIKVAVRVRPFNRRELELNTQCVVDMEDQQTILRNAASIEKIDRKQPKTFAFDHCFYSTDKDAAHFASQEKVFDSVGRDILQNAFQGYNACIFAYGQTDDDNNQNILSTQNNENHNQTLSQTQSTPKNYINNDISPAKTTNNDSDSNDMKTSQTETPLPDWIALNESVLIRPSNLSGVISFIGTTHFSSGTWVGVVLDTPMGKNDGIVQNIQYFSCEPKHGIFVRGDKLIQDKRGKAMRAYKAEKLAKERESSITRSKSRGDALNTVGTQRK